MHTHTPWERLTLEQTMQVSAQMRHCSAVAQQLQYNKTTWWNELCIQKRPPATTYPHLASLLTYCLPYSQHCLTPPQGISYSTSCVNMVYCSMQSHQWIHNSHPEFSSPVSEQYARSPYQTWQSGMRPPPRLRHWFWCDYMRHGTFRTPSL